MLIRVRICFFLRWCLLFLMFVLLFVDLSVLSGLKLLLLVLFSDEKSVIYVLWIFCWWN